MGLLQVDEVMALRAVSGKESDEEHVFHTDITFVRVDESGNKMALCHEPI